MSASILSDFLHSSVELECVRHPQLTDQHHKKWFLREKYLHCACIRNFRHARSLASRGSMRSAGFTTRKQGQASCGCKCAGSSRHQKAAQCVSPSSVCLRHFFFSQNRNQKTKRHMLAVSTHRDVCVCVFIANRKD